MTNKLFATAIFVLLGLVMITAHLPFGIVFAEDDGGGSDNGGGDGGKDSGGDDGGGGHDSGDSDSGSKDDGGDEDSGDSGKEDNDNSKDDNDNSAKSESEEPDDNNEPDDADNQAADKEATAATDEAVDTGTSFQADDNGEENSGDNGKSVPPTNKIKDDPNEFCDSSECFGPGSSKEGEDVNCVGKYCAGGTPGDKDKKPRDINCKGDWCGPGLKPDHPTKYPQHPPDNHPWKCHDKGHWDCHPKGHPDHPNHPNHWCKWHDCHHHTHHGSSTSFHNHDGDVTVKVNLKYKEKNSKNLNDVHLIIGDVYEKNLDLSKKPDEIKVDNLDIDGGDDFAVCLANEDSQDGSCTVAEADNSHDTVTVWLDVK